MLVDDVSRETLDQLEAFSQLVARWNSKINLVSRKDDLWSRHVLDAIQIMPSGKSLSGLWLDLGSGGGFPAIPCAIVAKNHSMDLRFHLLESDLRKCVFLKAAVTEFDLNVKVINERIEEAEPQGADIISARALADLAKLLELSERHALPQTVFLFQKGQKFAQEIHEARKLWMFGCEIVPSKTAIDAATLRLKDVSRV